MTIAKDPLFFAKRLGHGLAERDPHVFNRMMGIDRKITGGAYLQIQGAMASHLIEHVIEKRYPRVKRSLASTIEVNAQRDLGLLGVAVNRRGAGIHVVCQKI